MKYFVQDPHNKQFHYFDTIEGLIKYLEFLCQDVLKLTRAQYMDNLASLGHGYDDPKGVTFTQTLAADHFYMGAVKPDGQHYRCDVTSTSNFNQAEYGD